MKKCQESIIKAYDPTKDTTPQLSSDYWDCQCEENFIQPNAIEKCPHCEACRDEMPDSRQYEVEQGKMFNKVCGTCKYLGVVFDDTYVGDECKFDGRRDVSESDTCEHWETKIAEQ